MAQPKFPARKMIENKSYCDQQIVFMDLMKKRIVMERGNGIIRSCSQGGFLQAPDSSWWYMHQLIQNTDYPFQGRPQCLEPVKWIDGWPILGIDVDEDGIGEPVVQHRKPIQGFPVTAPASDDDFSQSKLEPQWEWNHNPRTSHWSLTERPGWLRLKAGSPLDKGEHTGPRSNQWTTAEGSETVFWRAYNTLSQRIMGITNGVAVSKFDISNMAPGQRGGAVRYGGVSHLLGIVVDQTGKRNLFFMDKLGKEILGPEIMGAQFYVRTTNEHHHAYFEYSTDGKTFKRFGPSFIIEFGTWTGDRLGFFCWNEKGEKGHIDIDWFTYSYDGPKG